ncbi:hypothetical protein B0H67DRAFT_650419 [Lasiosphaeris hirsuta]|uniref:Polyketide synthase n=1 Tax=Lasiosphaeris hirsuta TaxID=260670 RepID=A0AA40DIV9_9PEZI|nr:hypothetical protein B0H67DRAFT_650419 [Lasiosphaeris hirsuta]
MAASSSKDGMANDAVIIGMACRVPGATSPGGLWQNILHKKDLWKSMPKDRFNIEAFHHPDHAHKGTINTQHGYFIDQPLGDFDAEFFGVPGKEAEAMDPQQRLLLEVTYEALEDAGIPINDFRGSRTSVYCGMYTTSNDYHNLQGKDLESYPKYAITGTGNSILSNRISYIYNLHGPSMTVDTACSSSLTAFHLGCESLHKGEADMAIVVGSALHFAPNTYQTMSDMGFISSDGRCRSFDADGSGYVRGDAVCAIVLKKHNAALAAGDPVHAVVRGTGVNHDGKTDGITLPSPEAQEALIREAHGTGTKAGDPREATAIGSVFGTSSRDKPLYLGSVKSNIGHSEGAAGLTGIIKATLALKHAVIPPNMHFNTPNPEIPFDKWKLSVPTTAQEWVTLNGKPRRASVNSFGYGGANAHVVLEEPPSQGLSSAVVNGVSETRQRPYLIPTTSHSQSAGEKALKALSEYLRNKDNDSNTPIIRDLAYSLCTRRSFHQYRTFKVTGHDISELADELRTDATSGSWTKAETLGKPLRVGFIFTGQGAQIFNMGRELIELSPKFYATLQLCDEILGRLPDGPGWSIIEELLRSESESHLPQSKYSQPICTAVQVGLVDLLREWGIRPSSVCGHSSGEIAAAYAAGVLNTEGAIVAAFYRGLYMASEKNGEASVPGAMMAVGLSELDARAELATQFASGRLTVAAINSPSSVTISGDADAVAELREELLSRNVFARELKVEQAFHSHHMIPLAPGYQVAMEHSGLVKPELATCRMFSSVTARLVQPSSLGPAYWAANMVQPVRFSDAVIGAVLDENEEQVVDVLLEVGPHPVLKGPTRETLKGLGLEKMPYIATLSRGLPALHSLLATAGSLFSLGYPVDLRAVNGPGTRLDDLPRYAWNHKNYWSLPRLVREHLHRPSRHTLLGVPVPGAIHHMPRWRNYIRLNEIPWLRDHCVDGKVVYPAAGYCCMAIEAAVRLRPDRSDPIAAIHLKEVLIKAPLSLVEDDDEGAETQLELRAVTDSARTFSDEWYEFSVSSFDNVGQETMHCHGRIYIEYGTPRGLKSLSKIKSANTLVAASDRRLPATLLYERLKSLKLQYGKYFALLSGDIASGLGFSVASFPFDPSVFPAHELEERTILHPTLLDSTFHVLFSAIETQLGRQISNAFVSTYMQRLDISGLLVEQAGRPETRNYTVQTHTELRNQRTAVNHILLHETGTGELIVEATGNEVTALGSGSHTGQGRALFFRQRWQPCFDLLDGEQVDSLETLVKLYLFQHPSSRILLVMKEHECRSLLSCLATPVTRRPLYSALHALAPDAEADGINFESEVFTLVAEPQGPYDLVILDTEAGASPEYLDSSLASDGVFVTKNSFPRGLCVTSGSGWTAYSAAVNQPQPGIEVTIVLPSGPTLPAKTHAIIKELEAAVHVTLVTTVSIDSVAQQGLPTSSVVVLSSLDEGSVESSLEWAGTRHLLSQEDITLVWVVQGASMEATNFEHSKILGLLRVARNENQKSRLISLDMQHDSSAKLVSKRVLSALDPRNTEEDFSDRDGKVYIPRIEEDTNLNRKLPNGVGSEPSLSRFGDHPFLALRIGQIGLLETLHFTSDTSFASDNKSPLGEHEVEVCVKASALNFHDLAVALGIIHDNNMGNECAGVVTGVGCNVTELGPGDRVVAYRPGRGAHQTLVRQDQTMCLKIPDDMSFALATSLPITLTTAYYSLFTIGRLQKGETVLIHSGAGGVGQVAIQLAQNAGARVLVTCSEPKRAMLRGKFGLSDSQIFSSRDDSFVHGVMGATDGNGVDLALNSLAGKLLSATWSCMAPFGRFIEIGKRDIHQNSNLAMDPFRNNVLFASVDMILVCELNPALAARLLREAFHFIFSGEITAPDVCEFTYGQAERAFRLMQLGKHTGKIVLTVDKHEKVQVAPPTYRHTPLFRPDKTYLLVGGLGGLGTATAEWMFLRGARKFAFLSRSGDQKDYSKRTIAWLESKKAEVTAHVGDVTVLADVRDTVQRIGPSLAGVFHIAVVLQDGMIRSLSFEQYQMGLRAKCVGAWNLHEATLGCNLDFFVCWSSVSAVCGNKGQGAYVAASAYMDALMRWRREQGLVGTAMNLGAVPTRGLVAENEHLRKSLDRNKLDVLTEEELMFLVEEAVLLNKPAAESIDGLDWHQLIAGINISQPDVWWAERSVFQTLYANRSYGALSGGDGHGAGQVSTASRLTAASNMEEKVAILQEAFIQKVARVLGTPPESIIETNPLSFYGLDSIVAVEFRKWFKETVDVDLSLFDIIGAKSTRALVEKVAALMPLTIAVVTSGEGRARVPVTNDEPTVNGPNTSRQQGVTHHIPRVQTTGPLPMSSFQERMFARHLRAEKKSQLNIAGILRIEGYPPLEPLHKAFDETVRRHQVLSSAFFQDGNRLLQLPLSEPTLTLAHRDVSRLESPQTKLQDVILELRRQEFKIDKAEVATMTLIKTAESERFVVFVAHHICFDRASLVILMDDWMDLCDAVHTGRGMETVPRSRISYADFSVWHNALLQTPAAVSDREFWAHTLGGIPPASSLLPFAREARSGTWQTARRFVTVQLPGTHSKRMKRICAHLGATPFHFLLAAWRAYLLRYIPDDDLVILMFDGNRPHADAEAIIGCMANLLPLRFRGDCSATNFETVVSRARDVTLQALSHSTVSFDDIADAVLERQRPAGHMALGQIAINFQSHGAPWVYRHAEFDVAVHKLHNIGHPCEIVLEVVEGAKGNLDLIIQHSTTLYGDEDMDRFAHGFAKFVMAAVADHRQSIGEVDVDA